MTDKHQTAGHLAAIGTIFIWGTTYVSTKVLLGSFTPIEILFSRFLIGYIALLLIYPHQLKTKNFKEELLFMCAGLCGVTLYFLFENIALTYTLASNVGIIISIAPLLTAVLAHFLLHGERLQPRFFIGFTIAITGIILIGFNGSFILKLNPLGDLLATLAAVIWAVYCVLMRKISVLNYNTIACTRRAFFYGLIFMVPTLFFFKFQLDFTRFHDIGNLLNILFLGLGASALCFVSWNWAVGVLGVVKTSFYIYAVPVITIVSAAIILHEELTPIAYGGALLTLGGLFISERKAPLITEQEEIVLEIQNTDDTNL
ncbi:EamA family transporter [Clostridium aminobutyricum]|uniref:DMT family transporter n=1 Tax=Clostridium aminobutyricum TaxID=33953 RepID=A0A939IGD2_CLOAM|nr:DMT family transporter [Clostridium aminobutyricum]